jgi:hypothetical protein
MGGCEAIKDLAIENPAWGSVIVTKIITCPGKKDQPSTAAGEATQSDTFRKSRNLCDVFVRHAGFPTEPGAEQTVGARGKRKTMG